MYLIYNDLCYYKNKQLKGNITDTVKELSTLDLKGKKMTQLDNVIFFQNRYDGNFRHFITETLYLLSYVFSNKFSEDCLIMIDKNSKQTKKYKLQVLEILGYQSSWAPRIIYRQKDHVYKVHNLIWSDRIVDYKDKHFKILINTLINNSKKMSNERQTIKSKDNIYLSREHMDVFTKDNTPKRWVTNLDEVTTVFYENGFHRVRVDNLDLWDQITIINNAKKIITIIGANCENILFSNKNSKFLILYSDNQSRWGESYAYSDSWKGIKCLSKDNTVFYNPNWGGNDHLNGPYKANIYILKNYMTFYK